MDAINSQKRSRLCFVDEISCLCVHGISSLCGKEISVFTLCRDSDVDGAWQERDLIRPRYVLSKVFPGRVHHHGRQDHHHDQDDDHDDHQT